MKFLIMFCVGGRRKNTNPYALHQHAVALVNLKTRVEVMNFMSEETEDDDAKAMTKITVPLGA